MQQLNHAPTSTGKKEKKIHGAAASSRRTSEIHKSNVSRKNHACKGCDGKRADVHVVGISVYNAFMRRWSAEMAR